MAPRPISLVPLTCFRRSGGFAAPITRRPSSSKSASLSSSSLSLRSSGSDPLSVLFCGSDHFSCESLRALQREALRDPGLIRSVDVLVRPAKPTGRGLKTIRHSPVKIVADQLNLQVHERDTFTGWTMPDYIQLIVAVSFGLFVPPRILHAAKYGGLNLHPSLLPDLRGPAPIQHAILAGRCHTGVTLQTLDAHAFDRGVILDQTPRQDIPISPTATTPALTAILAPLAADMLIGALRSGLHLPPLKSIQPAVSSLELVHARKLTKTDRRINPADTYLTAIDVLRRFRALGPLWIEILCPATHQPIRLVLNAISDTPCAPFPSNSYKSCQAAWPDSDMRTPVFVSANPDGDVVLPLALNQCIAVSQVTVSGRPQCPAARALAPLLSP